MKTLSAVFAAGLTVFSIGGPSFGTAAERVHIDDSGVMRWSADNREVALFGANYCLPSSSDYRAAGYLGVDRKKLIEQDMTHFARMGWDGLRLAIWGDWENCDREGNLIVNDHLDLLDYLIFCVKQRGISMLFTPIHRHSALWPDGKDSEAIQGFSKFHPPAELGTNPAAIAAQQNYIRQILQHVNPYTGVALKDEPSILFIELINEPHHHADDFAGSVSYIDALADAVRDTGCEKLLFYNLSQDFRMGPAIAASKVQGFTFGWYPTGLVARRTLHENYLRWVDSYTPLHEPDVPKMPRLVYEFDSADILSGYMYPAMARAYREVGAQFAAMFAYDMLATAPYNLGWQTHYLNPVYSPKKAVSAIIAAEVMRTLPRGETYGGYPENRRFGPFRVSYEEDSSEMTTSGKFLHANDTLTSPPNPTALQKIVGVGSSPVVDYPGLGSYFLDKLADGQWRLELYPDALFVQDPFAQRLNYQSVSSQLVWRTWPMHLTLPDLGSAFSVKPLNRGNTHRAEARNGTFDIRPGVYLLSRDGMEAHDLPRRVGQLALDEFVCPPAQDFSTQVVSHLQRDYSSDRALNVEVDVVSNAAPTNVVLRISGTNDSGSPEIREILMSPKRGYRYAATIPAQLFPPGSLELSVIVKSNGAVATFPESDKPAWTAKLVEPSQPVVLFEAARDANLIFTLRTRTEQPGGYLDRRAATADEPATVALHFPANESASPHALALSIKDSILDRATNLSGAKSIRATVRGTGELVQLALIENDGTTWITDVPLERAWASVEITLSQLRPGTALKIPQGYPGTWNRDLLSPTTREQPSRRPALEKLEHLQLHATFHADSSTDTETSAELRSIELILK